MKKEGMIKIRFLLSTAVIAAITAGCANNRLASSTTQPAAARDYQALAGTWQLTRGVANGRAVPASEVRRTIVITDGNTFRFPKASGVGTHPTGTFTVDTNTRPKQVDSVGPDGPHAGQVTRGIYEILGANQYRACWSPPGAPRPTEFESPQGSHRVLQYWKKIGPVPSH
jgi:uncharacterized protein (TIGR03067 family)